VVRVNMINTAAKRSRRARSRRLLVRSAGFKKAIVTLAEGNTLEMFEGVQ
jgi:ribosomal protein L23